MNAGNSRWLFGRPDEIRIENDTLFVYQYDVEDDNSVHRFPVITKEEFIYHIENKTSLGEEINNIIISLSTANDYEKNLTDFINLLFN